MKLRFIIASLVVFFCVSELHAKDYVCTTVKGDPMNVRIYTLDNGLKVYMSVNKEKPRLQTYIGVRTGSRNDPAETTGLAHYLEHLMFKGTDKFGTSNYAKEKPYLDEIEARYENYRLLKDSAERIQAYHEIDSVSQLAAQYNIPNEYDKLMSAIGAEGTNAYTSNDITCYVENIPNNEIESWAKIQAERFQNLVIRGFHTELEAVYEEYNMGLTSDGGKQWVAFNKKMFPTHPYGTQTTIGTQDHLKNPSIVNIKNYFNRYYVPNNVVISLAGDFDPQQAIQIIDKYFGSWKKSESLSRPEYAPVRQLTTPVDTTVIGLEAENLLMGWMAKGASSLQVDTLTVIADMLVNGKCGLMDVNLMQSMKINTAGAYYEGLTDYGEFLIQAYPKDGQTLEEVRQLLLNDIENLKQGHFDEDLVQAVVNNLRLNFNQSLLCNKFRAEQMTDAFINGTDWSNNVAKFDRMARITKAQIVDFASRYFTNGYVTVFKRQGEDTTQKKIDKPAITPIPSNRELSSDYLQAAVAHKVEPVQPKFVDFKKELTFGTAGKNLPLIYKQNTDDELFSLSYKYDFGKQADNKYSLAASYLDYIGTKKQSLQQIQKAFYELACNYRMSVQNKHIYITLTGLKANMPKAMALLDQLMNNAKADAESWETFKGLYKKNREDMKKNQRANFNALFQYGRHGKWNDIRNTISNEELDKLTPNDLTALIKGLANYEHTVLYFGPDTQETLSRLVAKNHTVAKKLQPALENREFVDQQTTKNEVLMAPYDAKNIYLVMYHNEGKPWNKNELGVSELFNEYFGGGMNTVVFQELRETRGLAYSAFATYNNTPEKGKSENCYTYIISQNDKMGDCIKVFNEILDTIPQSQKAFDLAKQALIKRLQAQRTTRFSVINAWLSAQERGLDYDLHEELYRQLPSVTMQDVVDFEQRAMARKPYRYIILGDEKKLDLKVLENIAPIERLSTDEIFGY